jgi:AcrR family transcriptional regulator
MPNEKSHEGAGGDPEIATPGRALERLRSGGRAAAAERRRRLARAAVELSGEVGYRRLTVGLILTRAEIGRSAFYRCFANRQACYQEGYEAGIEELARRLLEEGRETGSWAEGMRAALEELAGFLAAEPDYAAGLLAQVHVAGAAALGKRNEVSERLSRAIDGARRETLVSRHSPPPIAAPFILNAIEQSALNSIARGAPEEFARTVPELLRLAVSTYFGHEPAADL